MLIDCHNHIGAGLLFYLHGDFPYAQQLVQMQQEGGALGVTRWIAAEVAALQASPPEVVGRIADRNTRAYLKLSDESILV